MRIIKLADSKESRAQFLRGFKFTLGLVAGVNLRRAATAAAAGQRRQRLDGGSRAAEMIDQRAECTRTRYYGANAGSPK